MPVTLRQVFESSYLRGLYGIKPVRQTKPNACGACCVATALQYFGTPVTEQNCVDAMGTTEAIGTDPIAMLKYLSGKAFNAYSYTSFPVDRLLGFVQSGKVVLIRWPDRADHWNLVAGMEPLLERVVLVDPAAPQVFRLMPVEEFEHRWAASDRLVVCIDRPLPGREKAPLRKTTFRVRDYYKNHSTNHPPATPSRS